MRIYSKVVMYWDDSHGKYLIDDQETESYFYDGPVARLCGATSQQTQIAGQQSQFMTTAMNQAQQIFGDSSSVFGDLVKTFAPTVAAGASQLGFSAGEKSNLDSQAITETGQAYKNAKEAVGEAQSAQGGGNTGLVAGSSVGTDLGIASSAAAQTSGELNQINEADYSTGRQNYDLAVQGLAGAPNVFGAAEGATNAATNAGSAATTAANDVAQESNSWESAALGALGSVAGAATTAGFNSGSGGNPGSGAGGSGGSEANGDDNGYI